MFSMNFKSKISKQNTTKCVTILENNNFALVESYKSLRTNILFSLPMTQSGCRKVLFTSSNPAEGKSTTCINTAITLAQADMKVLVVDADMRKPTVHKYFNLANKVGLSNILIGMNSVEECINSIGSIQNGKLNVITSGVLPPNPSELLSGENMAKLLENLSSEYDFIVVDTPPINVVTDALAICNNVDGVVVVTAQNITKKDDVVQAVSSLKFAGANVLGFVLNRQKKASKKYGGSSYKYEYAYAYTDNDESSYDESVSK